MFSQFINVVEGLAHPHPRPPQTSHDRPASVELGQPSSPARPSAERPLKTKLEDRLRASFTIGEASNATTPSASSRVSPAPQFVNEHPLIIDHPLSPAAIPLPSSPPPTVEGNHDLSDAPLMLPDSSFVVLSDVLDQPVSSATASNIVTEPEPVSQHSPSNSPLVDSPIIPTASEQKPAASEEGTTQSTITRSISDDPTKITLNGSVENTAPAAQHESSEVRSPTDTSDSASADVEALQERLQSMEQQFIEISASLAKLQSEKATVDKVLQDITSVKSIQDVDGLRDYLQNTQLKVEISQDEVKRLTGKLTRQEERIEEIRETHRLESTSQVQLVDELRNQLRQNEALLNATRSSNSKLEADVAKHRNEADQLRSEVEKLDVLAKSEEEKCNKAINHLKTVRQRLVKTEKEREDALRDAAAAREGQKTEHDKEQLERERLQANLNKLKIEKEVSLADLRAQFEKDLLASKQRNEKEISVLRGQFELETVTAKSSHEHAMSQMDAQISRLERSIHALSTEKDGLFDQFQMRQAEVESAQSLLEVLQSQSTELHYQVREKDGRIALLNEELSDFRQEQHFGASDPSTSPEEVAKLLAAAESRHEAKLSVLKQKLAGMEAERVEVEAEWRRKVEAKVQEAQKWKSIVESTSKSRQEDDDHTQELQAEVERLRSAARAHGHETSQLRQQIEHLTLDEEATRQQLDEQVKRISVLDLQLEEITAKEHQARAHSKTLREELRKVQSSAALLDRQRGPGLGYWSSGSVPDVTASSSVSSRLPNSSRLDPSVSKSQDEEVNLEYLRNVIFQFLEHKEMRPDLVRVLSTILRFTPQETRRLIAKV